MIPKYDEIMLPLLKFAAEGKEHSKQEAVSAMRKVFNLSDEEFFKLLPSGRQRMFDNRVAWAKSYMKQARLIESTRRGYFKITDRGKEVLESGVDKIDKQYLMQFEEFRRFVKPDKKSEDLDNNLAISDFDTPEELIAKGYEQIYEELIGDIKERLAVSSPAFFEQVVIDLLLAMGYGGSRQDAGEAIGRSGDEGIDGIIKEDKLGLDIIYIQAKRWTNASVGRPEIQKFAGALDGKRAKKGIFITLGEFTPKAMDYVKGIDKKIILIDGNNLARLMIDYNVGVDTVATYEIKKIDNDYFEE